MKLNIENVLEERNQIANSSRKPIRYMPLFESDKINYKCQLEEIYKQMLHEVATIDDCCRRFEKMFRWN